MCRIFQQLLQKSLGDTEINENEDEDSIRTIEEFKNKLRWNEMVDGKWFDRDGVSLLLYAVVSRNECVVEQILKETKGRHDIVNARISKQGYPTLGIPGSTTTLLTAMGTCTFER